MDGVIMKAKVLSVYDEGSLEDTPYIGAKGFSVLIDVDGERTLFDTGMRGRYLIHNLDFLEIKADSIDRVVISHDHMENMGGLWKLIDSRKRPLDIYVNERFQSLKRLFGRPFFSEEQASKVNIHVMDDDTRFSKNLMAVGPFGDMQEFSLVVTTKDGPVVITSDCHAGIGRVLEKTKTITGKGPHNLIGGLIVRRPSQKTVDPVADVIEGYGSPHMYLNHSAENGTITYMRVRFNLKGVDNFYVGTSVGYEVDE